MKKLNISNPFFRKSKQTKKEAELHKKVYTTVKELCHECLNMGVTKDSLKEVVESALDEALNVTLEERLAKIISFRKSKRINMHSATALDLTTTKRGSNFKVRSTLVKKILPLDWEDDYVILGLDQAFEIDGKVSILTNEGKIFQLSCSEHILIDTLLKN